MVRIIATTDIGGMEIGRTYIVGAETASTLVRFGRARYEGDKVEEVKKLKQVRKRRTKKA